MNPYQNPYQNPVVYAQQQPQQLPQWQQMGDPNTDQQHAAMAGGGLQALLQRFKKPNSPGVDAPMGGDIGGSGGAIGGGAFA